MSVQPPPEPSWAGTTRNLLAPFLIFVLAAVLVLTAMRLSLLVGFRSRLGSTGELPLLFLTGLRFDGLLLAYLLIPAWLVVCLAPERFERVVQTGLHAYLVTWLAIIVTLECAAWPSLREFGSRPEALFLEFLGHPREVVGMLVHGFLQEALLAGLALVVAVVSFRRILRPARPAAWPRFRPRLILLLPGATVLFLGARSSLQHRPANLSSAVFSQNHFHNEAALNSTYTLLYAVYRRKHETESERDYGDLPLDRIQHIVRHESGFDPATDRGSALSPMLHLQTPLAPRQGRPPNVVVILLESFGAEYTGRLGGTALTPAFDRLAAEGLAFDQLFATGTRTARAMEAVIAGFFPTPARSVLKLGRSQRDFFTAPGMFGRAGYSTHFIYGGAANFDEMKSFLTGNGVREIWDQSVLEKPGQAVGVWGIHDEDLLLEADALFRRLTDQPFFALILSTSNHTPFDYPEGKIIPDPNYPAASPENAIKYTDYALGKFFEEARKSPYFANTLFLVVADHGTRVSGDQLIPVHKFHVPAVIIGPRDLVAPGRITRLASQVDLMPTLLALTGRAWEHPMMGRNLMELTAPERMDPLHGRALLQYETHFGYWRDGEMVILRPNLPAAQFAVDQTEHRGAAGFRLMPDEPDSALVEAALAHSLFPSWLYRKRLYRLPPLVRP